MELEVSLFSDSFAQGVLATLAVVTPLLAAFAVGLEVGETTASGGPVDLPVVVAVVGGAVASVAGFVAYRREH